MRIALAHSHPNTFGGGERCVLEVARGLQPRHQVRLLVGKYEPEQTYPELSRFPATRLSAGAWLTTRVTDEVAVANSFGANLLALRNGARVAYWVHSVRSRFLQPGARRPDLLARRALDLVAVRRAARLVANSRYTAARLRRLYGRAADAVVYPGVDVDDLRPGRNDGKQAIYVGRLAPEKGVERLLAVWRAVPEIPLVLVGGGEPAYVAALHAQAPPGVHFRGPLPPATLWAAYRDAAVAVFAPYGEEFGIAPLEAMACGLPVVAWREGGVVETVIDGQTGYLVGESVTFAERVREVVHNPTLRRTLGEAARARAEQFTWQRTVAGVERICVEIGGRDDTWRAP